jgi:hypothetical protein
MAEKRKVNDEKDNFSFGSVRAGGRGRFDSARGCECIDWDSGTGGDVPSAGIFPGSASVCARACARGSISGSGVLRARAGVLPAATGLFSAGAGGEIRIWLWALWSILSPWALVMSGGTGVKARW